MAFNICRTEAAPPPPPTIYVTTNYTVPRDIYARYVILANNITFNFNNKVITGNGDGNAIYMSGRTGITFIGSQ